MNRQQGPAGQILELGRKTGAGCSLRQLLYPNVVRRRTHHVREIGSPSIRIAAWKRLRPCASAR